MKSWGKKRWKKVRGMQKVAFTHHSPSPDQAKLLFSAPFSLRATRIVLSERQEPIPEKKPMEQTSPSSLGQKVSRKEDELSGY